jgi:hypothetical protein
VHWRKAKVDGIPCWRSGCETYLILHNICDGLPPKNYRGELDRHGYRWVFEIVKIDDRNKEVSLGTAATLRSAKVIAELDEEGM